jgi:hypothetical protein
MPGPISVALAEALRPLELAGPDGASLEDDYYARVQRVLADPSHAAVYVLLQCLEAGAQVSPDLTLLPPGPFYYEPQDFRYMEDARQAAEEAQAASGVPIHVACVWKGGGTEFIASYTSLASSK